MIYHQELYLSTRPSLQKGLSRLKSRLKTKWRLVAKGSRFRLSNGLCYCLGTRSFFGRELINLIHGLASNFVDRERVNCRIFLKEKKRDKF